MTLINILEKKRECLKKLVRYKTLEYLSLNIRKEKDERWDPRA